MVFGSNIRDGIFKFMLFISSFLNPQAETLYAPEKPETFNYTFTIKDLKQNKLPFERFKGKVLFINLWATWCGPCRAEMPTIEALYKQVSRDDIQFVVLSVDADHDRDKVLRFIEKNNYTFPVFMPSGNLPAQLQVPSIPTTLIVDKQGRIVKKKTGMTNYNTEYYKKLMEELARQ